MIEKYNKIIEEIVKSFATRYYKEVRQEEVGYYHIMNYVGINQGPVELCDMYLDVDDIIVSEKYQIPSNIFTDYYYLCITTEGKPGINLYNYWRREKDKALYEKEEKESLRKSEENVKRAKKSLEDNIKELGQNYNTED